MSIQILGLRPYYSKKYKKLKLKELWFPPKAKSISSLFSNLEKLLEEVPEGERYNLFYTCAHNGHQDRKVFESCDVIAFDIDNISIAEKEAYLAPLSTALKIELSKCIVVWSGNGVQIIIKLKESVTRDFFQQKEAYKYWIDRINKSLEEEGLPGNADPSIFDPTRVLRLPLTRNIKPMEEPLSESAKVREATVLNRELEYFGWELGQGTPQVDSEKKSEDFGPIDSKAVLSECLFLQHVKENQAAILEPTWRAALGVTAFFKDHDKASHDISCKHPNYTREETQSQVDRIRSETSGPRLCKGIDELWGGCKGCKWNKKVKTPVQIKSPEFYLNELDFIDPTSKPSEMQVVAQLLKNFSIKYEIKTNVIDDNESDLVQYEGELFRYNGKIWVCLDEAEINTIMRAIGKFYNFKGTSSKVESTFKTFKKFIPHPPANKNFFEPNPRMANFQNGTLHLIETEEGDYSLDFKPHSKWDYLTNIIPGDYDPTFTETNSGLSELLDRIFDGDIDKDEKIRTLAQMFGAALMAAFPHFFFLHGVAGGGKSTICILLSLLLEKNNLCGVQPHEFEGFNLESMAGKLVNMVTDVSSKAVIGDDVVKQIEDRMPMRIRRKNKKDIYAPLPAIHVFGANALPKNFDGASRAHDRRWSLIPFNNSLTNNGQVFKRDYGNFIFKKCPQGVLNFAVKGLLDLITCKGHFCNPASGKAALNSWQTENDIIAQFLEDFGDGCLSELSLNQEGKISRTKLWDYFCEWRDESGRKHSKLTRNVFYKALEDKGFEQTKYEGNRQFIGIDMNKQETPENVRPIRF